MNGDRKMPARENYPIVPLDELCDLCSGITKGRKLDSADTVDVPYMAVANVQDGWLRLDNVKTIEATPEEIERYSLRPGDLLLTEGGDPDKLGRGAIWNGEIGTCIHQNHIFRARKATERIEMEYLARLVSSPYGKRYFLRQSKQTTGIASINMGQLKRFPVPLPSLEEQRRIAAILGKAETIESLAAKRSILWPQLARSLFYEMFGDVNSNPFKYPVATLGDLLSSAEIFRDGDWVESKDQDPSGDVRLIQLADVGDGFYIDKSYRHLTYETSIRLRCTHLKRGDILVARMPDPLCRACIFPGDSKISVTVVDVCIIRVNPGATDPIWLTWMINSPEFRSNAISSATGTTRSRISRGNLSKLPVLLPPLAAQKRFALTLSKAISLFSHENFSYSSKSLRRIRRAAAALRNEVFCGQK